MRLGEFGQGLRAGATVAVIAALSVSVVGCRSSTDTPLKEVQRVRAANLDVVVLSEDGTLADGKDTVTVEFRRAADGELVDVGQVKGFATMRMAGLPPMMGSVFLNPGDKPGRYTAETELSMSGGWDLKLEWNGPAGKGNASLHTNAE
jgi:hypothetical protein